MNFSRLMSDTCVSCRRCSCDCYKLPFLSQPFCPAVLRRKQTRQRLTEHNGGEETGYSTSRRHLRVVDSLKVVGKRLSVGSKEVSLIPTRYERLSACDCEHRPSPYADDNESTCHDTSLLSPHAQFSEVSETDANTEQHSNCCESCSCRSEANTTNEMQRLCYSPSQPCPTCQQLEQPCHNDLLECPEIDEVETSHNTAAATATTCRNVDENHLLKLLRKFDTIRQRARAAREACHFRFEMRQKQRLHLFDFTDSEFQKKTEVCQEVICTDDNSPLLENDEMATAVAMCYNTGVGLQRQETNEVKLRDIVDLCGRVGSETTWPPPLLDDDSTSKEPTDAVIGRLMSRFEQIRLDSLTARLENQKRFENKRKRRKYKI